MSADPDPTPAADSAGPTGRTVLPYRRAPAAADPPQPGGFVWLVVSWQACGAAVFVVAGGYAWARWQLKVTPQDEGIGLGYVFLVVLAAMVSGIGLLVALVAAVGDRAARQHYRRAVLPWLLALLATGGPIAAIVLRD